MAIDRDHSQVRLPSKIVQLVNQEQTSQARQPTLHDEVRHGAYEYTRRRFGRMSAGSM